MSRTALSKRSANETGLKALPIAPWRRKLDFKLDPSFGLLRTNPDQRKVAFQVQAPPKPEEVWVTENFLPVTKLGK